MEKTTLSDWINSVFDTVPDRHDEEVVDFLVTDRCNRFIKRYPFTVRGGREDRLLPRVTVEVTAQLTPNVNISLLNVSGCLNGRRVTVEADDASLRSKRRIEELCRRMREEASTPVSVGISFAGGYYVAYPPDFAIHTLYKPQDEREMR